MTLPTLTLELIVRNPLWEPFYQDGHAMNMDTYYTCERKECEVLTLNLNAGTMRVRYKHMDKVQTIDVASIEPFLEQYQIVSKAC